MDGYQLELPQAKMLVRLVEQGPVKLEDLRDDIVSRETLLTQGFANKIVMDGEDNFVAATHLGRSLYCKRIVGEDNLAIAIQKRKLQGEIQRLAR
jgi:hypothetical protein